MTTMSPPGIIDNLTPDELHKKAENLITDCSKLYDKVAAVQDSDVSYETVLKVLNEAEKLLRTRHFLGFIQFVSPNHGIRNASTKVGRKLREFYVEISMRKDIFQKLLVLEKKGESLNLPSKRYLEKLISIGKRNGLHLDENTQKQVKDMNSKLHNLCRDFIGNIDEVTPCEFSKEELSGLSDDYLEGLKEFAQGSYRHCRTPLRTAMLTFMKRLDIRSWLKIKPEKYEVPLENPHYVKIMQKCKIPETRKKLHFAFNTQCLEENGRILAELRKIRHELAVLLGYPNRAAYKTEILMAKNPQTVNKFLSDLAKKMTPLWQEEKKHMLELKEKECAELGIPFDGKLNSWDTTYYATKTIEIKYGVYDDKLREYFPFPVVKAGLFKICQDLLGLKFDLVQGDTWHEDVELYGVTDSNNGKLMGYFYLDLYLRPNKCRIWPKASFFELQNPLELPDGTRQVAVLAIVMNFTKTKKDTVLLLDHDEVITFCHAIGHVMHSCCVEVNYARFSCCMMESDFTEAPSQMLENWCWENKPLKAMSSHYKDNSKIPDDVVNALVKSRTANIGHFYLYRILLATLDLRIHSSPEGDITELYHALMREILGIEPQAGTNFACGFSRLATQHDANYYGLIWSEVYAMDMFHTRFGSENVFNPAVGKDYRDKILRPGGEQEDAYDMLCNFLGREPNQEAFLRSIGLTV